MNRGVGSRETRMCRSYPPQPLSLGTRLTLLGWSGPAQRSSSSFMCFISIGFSETATSAPPSHLPVTPFYSSLDP